MRWSDGFLAGGGRLGELMRAHDWAATSLGAPSGWPAVLKALVSVVLGSSQPMFMAWGPSRTMLYNDAYSAILGSKHPAALGSDVLEAWSEIREDLRPLVERAFGGESIQMDDIQLRMERNGYPEETHFSFSYTPVRDGNGPVLGFFCACSEITSQVLAERRALAERERQRLMLQQMPGFAAMLVGPEHRFEFVNDAYREIAGPRDFIGRTVREVFPDLERQGFYELLDRTFATGLPFVTREAPITFHNGGRHIDLLLQPVRDDRGQVSGIFASGYDVTEQVEARRRLAAERDRLASVLEGMWEGFALLDRDFRILDVNSRGLLLDGRRKEELTGRSHWEAYPGTETDEIGRLYRKAMSERVPVALEHAYRWPDGREAWLDMRAFPVPEGLAIFYRDITDRKRAEESLRESEDRFRNMADHAPVKMWVTDETGVCTYLNRLWHDFTGQTPEEALGMGWLDAVHPEDRARTKQAFLEALARREAVRLEYRLRRADGAYRWMIDAAAPRFDAGGGLLGYMGSVVDIDERREAEDEARRRSEELAAVLDAAPVVMCVARDPEAKMVTGNRLAGQLLRIPEIGANLSKTADDAGSTAHFAVRDGEGREVPSADLPIQRAARGETVRNCEQRIVFSDGQVIDFLGNATPLRDREGRLRGSVAAFVDITDRKRAAAALAQSEERFRLALDAAEGIGTWDWDLRTDRVITDGRFARRYGIDPALAERGLTLEAYLAIIHPRDRAAVRAQIEAAIATGDEFRADYRLVGPGSAERWVLARGRCLCDGEGQAARFSGVTFDLTERKRAETALRDLNEKLEQRVAAAITERNRLWLVSDDLFVTADFMGRLIEVSDSWTRLLGWGRPILLEMNYADLIHPDDLPGVRARLDSLHATVQSISYDNRVLTSDGSWRTIAWRLTADVEGQRIYGVGRDVTQEREQQQALQQTQKQLQEAQKMEAIGQLTGGVAHDFNNLLSAVLSNLDLARKRVSDLRTAQLLDGAVKGAERGAALTKRLLAFARRQELKEELIEVSGLFDEMRDLLGKSLGPAVRISFVLPETLPPVMVDANQLELAILNLAVNARDAMPGGGELEIRGDMRMLERDHIVEGLPAGRYVVISVADTGSGMSEATRKRAAEPFFTTKGVGQGTGLGLSMVHGLVVQSGGAMRIESRPGAGTTVELWLPRARAEEAEGREQPSEEPAPAASDGAMTVLVVDDDALVLMATAAMIEDLGHVVIEAASGAEALDIVERNPKLDLVVTDHAMPGMTGMQLAEALAALRPSLPCVLVTGYIDMPNGGAFPLPRLSKPVRQGDLLAMLEGLAGARAAAPASPASLP